jgi:hypothetical protein
MCPVQREVDVTKSEKCPELRVLAYGNADNPEPFPKRRERIRSPLERNGDSARAADAVRNHRKPRITEMVRKPAVSEGTRSDPQKVLAPAQRRATGLDNISEYAGEILGATEGKCRQIRNSLKRGGDPALMANARATNPAGNPRRSRIIARVEETAVPKGGGLHQCGNMEVALMRAAWLCDAIHLIARTFQAAFKSAMAYVDIGSVRAGSKSRRNLGINPASPNCSSGVARACRKSCHGAMKALTTILGTRTSDEAWRSWNNNLASRRHSSEVSKPRMEKYAGVLKTVAVVLIVFANQRADAMAHNPYTGWMASHNAMRRPPLSKFDDIGHLPIAVTLRGIEEAFRVAGQLFGKWFSPEEDIRQWHERKYEDHCDDTPACLNFAHLVALILCRWHRVSTQESTDEDLERIKTDPSGAERIMWNIESRQKRAEQAQRYVDDFEYRETFPCANTHDVRKDVRAHIDGFGLESLIIQAFKLRQWQAKSDKYHRSPNELEPEWGESEVWPHALALLAITRMSCIHGIAGVSTGEIRGREPVALRYTKAANAVTLALCNMDRANQDRKSSLALAAHLAKVALDGNEVLRDEPDNPVKIYLELRKQLYQFAGNYDELNNLSRCLVQGARDARGCGVEVMCPPVVDGGSDLVSALNEQPAESTGAGKLRTHLDLPGVPAVEIKRYHTTNRQPKNNSRTKLQLKVWQRDQKWVDQPVRIYGSQYHVLDYYSLIAAILHSSDSGKFALISSPWCNHSGRHQKRWAFFEPGKYPAMLKEEEAVRLIDGDGTGSYNAVLALYRGWQR